MKDQHDNEVPDDLVVLDVLPQELHEHDLRRVIKARWYQPEGRSDVILVSFAESGENFETDPLDCGVDLKGGVLYIADSLKRWSEDDGFYHA
jgi:hypothetical protein